MLPGWALRHDALTVPLKFTSWPRLTVTQASKTMAAYSVIIGALFCQSCCVYVPGIFWYFFKPILYTFWQAIERQNDRPCKQSRNADFIQLYP